MENLTFISALVPKASSNSNDNCTQFNFIFCFLIIGSLCILGIVGNNIAIIVLQNDKFHKVTLFLFKALAVADNTVLLLSFMTLSVIYGLLPFINEAFMSRSAVPFIIKYAHPFAYISHCCTIWITVVLAVYRYIAVCHPVTAMKWCTMFKTRLLIIMLIIVAILFNIPRFFQFEVIGKTSWNSVTNTTGKIYFVRETNIGEDTLFGIIYNHILYTVTAVIIPVIVLVIINGKLICEIKAIKARRHAVGLKNKVDENITLVLIVIILVVVTCHTPDRLMQLLRIFISSKHFVCGKPLFYVIHGCNMLVILNSSTNFIVYYLLWPAFHQKFMKWLCSKEESVVSTEEV